MSLGRLEISAGALFALALLYYLDRDGILPCVLLSCALHELGHWWAIRVLGGGVAKLRLSCAGAELRLSRARILSPGKMALAALAGPAVNLLLAWVGINLAQRGLGEKLYFLAGLNLGLACFNLLPAGWLDGGRAVENLLSMVGSRELGRQVTELCSAGVVTFLLLAGAALLWQSEGRNFTVLIAGLWMAGNLRQERQAGTF